MTREEHNKQVESWSESVKNLEHALCTARECLRKAIQFRHECFNDSSAKANQIETLRAELDDARQQVAELKQQLSGATL